MLNQEDLKWIATTSTELNSVLQQISRYSDLAKLPRGEHNYLEMLGERAQFASKTAQALFDRVTSNILESAIAKGKRVGNSSPPAFSIVPSPTGVPASAPSVPPATSPSPEPAQVSKAAAEFRILNPQGKRELVLIVDDDPELTELASQMLTDEDYQVILAKEGFEALKIYGHLGHRIRLVILDFFLPVMDGDAVFDELREINPNVNVVLSSGFAEQNKIGAMLARGLRGFIPKPYTREKLLEQVRSTLDARRHAMR